MAFVVKTAKTLRNHWKKSTFFFVVGAYGINYAKNRHNDNLLRRKYCEEAQLYGKEKIMLGHRPRRVTVFLNPAAKGGKARKFFDKTAAPILYLAGIEVNVVSTEYEGQVKNFMTVLDTKDTDAIVIAGGNGTLLEAVTGFLRKEDRNFAENIPLGVIPLGSSNSFFKILFGHDLDEVKAVAEAAIAVVRAITKKVDVIKLQTTDDKTTFALTGLEVGAYRDAEDRKTKYWYFGPLKSRWTYVRTAMKQWPPVINVKLSYIEATEANMAFVDADFVQTQAPRKSWNFVDFLFGRRHTKALDVKTTSNIEEENLEEMNRIHQDVSTIELTVSVSTLVDKDSPFKALKLSLGPSQPNRLQVINEGWLRNKRKDFKLGSEGDSTVLAKRIHIDVTEEGKWYNIDGEAYEAKPVDISLLRNKLNFFCPISTAT
ncbi:acylglycerol kinase, mitochondrial-like [Physella acuta]|uniref:acylglycerol kinase, mitochondrial-like n=1 Tax=Physella acuta TaxID=109671 RepID=UPI0027DC0042|nr:acylglycerol kinase, mitochondrial-like [Physella acuta]